MNRKSYERPEGAYSTSESAVMGALLGYVRYNGNAFTRDEICALAKFYKYTLGAAPGPLAAAGDMRNLCRDVEADGLRIMALLGRYLEPDEDPVKLVADGLRSLGFDVSHVADEGDGSDDSSSVDKP